MWKREFFVNNSCSRVRNFRMQNWFGEIFIGMHLEGLLVTMKRVDSSIQGPLSKPSFTSPDCADGGYCFFLEALVEVEAKFSDVVTTTFTTP